MNVLKKQQAYEHGRRTWMYDLEVCVITIVNMKE